MTQINWLDSPDDLDAHRAWRADRGMPAPSCSDCGQTITAQHTPANCAMVVDDRELPRGGNPIRTGARFAIGVLTLSLFVGLAVVFLAVAG